MDPEELFNQSKGNKFNLDHSIDDDLRESLLKKGERLYNFMGVESYAEKEVLIYKIKNNKIQSSRFAYFNNNYNAELQISTPLNFVGSIRIWVDYGGKKYWAKYDNIFSAGFSGMHLFYFLTGREEEYEKENVKYSPIERPSEHFGVNI